MIESILKKLINEPLGRNQCSVYLSVCIAYIEMQKWEEARHFLIRTKALMTDYEEQVAIHVLETIIMGESVADSINLLAYLKQ